MHVPASAVSTTTVDPSHNKYVTRAKAAIQKEDTSTFDNASAPTNNREDEKHYLINFLTEDLCDALLQMLSTAIFEAKFPANKRLVLLHLYFCNDSSSCFYFFFLIFQSVEPVVIKNIETIVTIASNICNYDNTKSAEFTKRLGAFYSYYKLELKKVESFPNGTVVVTTVQQIQPDNPSPLNMAAISGDGVSDAANPMALPYNSHLVQTIADGPHTHATPQIPTTLHPQHHIQPPGAPQLQPLQALHHLHPPQHLQHSQHLVPQALPPPYSSGAGNNELYSPQGQIDTLDRSFSEGTFSEALAPNSAAIPLDQTLQHLQMHHLPPHDRSLPTPILKHSPGAQITQPDHLQMHLSPSQAHVHFERNENLPFPDIASGGSPSEASMRMNSIPQPPSELGGLGNDATPLQTNIRSGPPPTHISSPPTENGSVSPAQSHSQHHPHPHPPVNLSPQTGSIEQSRPPTVMPEQGMGQSNLTPPSDFSQGQPRESPLTAETSGQPPGAASKPSDSLSGPIDLSQQSQSTESAPQPMN